MHSSSKRKLRQSIHKRHQEAQRCTEVARQKSTCMKGYTKSKQRSIVCSIMHNHTKEGSAAQQEKKQIGN